MAIPLTPPATASVILVGTFCPSEKVRVPKRPKPRERARRRGGPRGPRPARAGRRRPLVRFRRSRGGPGSGFRGAGSPQAPPPPQAPSAACARDRDPARGRRVRGGGSGPVGGSGSREFHVGGAPPEVSKFRPDRAARLRARSQGLDSNFFRAQKVPTRITVILVGTFRFLRRLPFFFDRPDPDQNRRAIAPGRAPRRIKISPRSERRKISDPLRPTYTLEHHRRPTPTTEIRLAASRSEAADPGPSEARGRGNFTWGGAPPRCQNFGQIGQPVSEVALGVGL